MYLFQNYEVFESFWENFSPVRSSGDWIWLQVVILGSCSEPAEPIIRKLQSVRGQSVRNCQQDYIWKKIILEATREEEVLEAENSVWHLFLVWVWSKGDKGLHLTAPKKVALMEAISPKASLLCIQESLEPSSQKQVVLLLEQKVQLGHEQGQAGLWSSVCNGK